jgi:hypothetical protein
MEKLLKVMEEDMEEVMEEEEDTMEEEEATTEEEEDMEEEEVMVEADTTTEELFQILSIYMMISLIGIDMYHFLDINKCRFRISFM